jgi:hypothetical protein
MADHSTNAAAPPAAGGARRAVSVISLISWLPRLRCGLDGEGRVQGQARTTVPGMRGDPARYAKRRPGRGCAVDRARPGRPGSMRGPGPRTLALTQPRNPDDVSARRRTPMTRALWRMLSALRWERAVREETGRRAGEQAALRRVATLVAGAAAPEEIFAAVAGELARLWGRTSRRCSGTRPTRPRPGTTVTETVPEPVFSSRRHAYFGWSNEPFGSSSAGGRRDGAAGAKGSGWLHAFMPRAAHDDDDLAALRAACCTSARTHHRRDETKPRYRRTLTTAD